ncbi:uncharacterized protein N7500_002881 [Penicillium coprophilum]|uniref:uncharacterized protein n=1 Tax=Penicillium coprophilum TaxID=36646 RepID=UPI002399280A|nr:uncharacterized protein N7500_002881 [Penicillium coprophilum]KAJ5170098.1 hypothetical protein N7500_002881 [Penicillium coprophilum]
MSLLSITLRIAAIFLRALARFQGRITSHPDEIIFIKSRGRNSIKIHVYRPPATNTLKAPSPVLLNFHGSGFVIPAHGSDDEFCRQMCQQTGFTVLDVQYRLSPENPFPAALNDTEDAAKWVLEQPEIFDLSRIATSGFSAVEALVNPGIVAAPDPNARPIPSFILRFFAKCYVPPGHDPKDPRISPAYADIDRFPRRVLIVTA